MLRLRRTHTSSSDNRNSSTSRISTVLGVLTIEVILDSETGDDEFGGADGDERYNLESGTVVPEYGLP